MSVNLIAGFDSANSLAEDVALRLSKKILEAHEHQLHFDLVLTGGGIGIMILEKLAPLLTDHDLSHLELWWGDERFVTRESEDRNELLARRALIDFISIPEANVHAFPSSNDGPLNQMAEAFAEKIEEAAPSFDIVLLGVGPDGHVASLFPNSAPEPIGNWVVIESDSPKPPKQRLSLSFQALCSAKEIWVVAAGAEKADAIAEAYLTDSGLPLAKVEGTEETIWFIDQAAASKIIS